VVAKWEGALDEARMRQHLEHETELEADAPEKEMPHLPPSSLDRRERGPLYGE
jgi:hypothetical protein